MDGWAHCCLLRVLRERTWVKEDDGPQAAQLCLVHLHIPHLIDQLRENPAPHTDKESGENDKKRKQQEGETENEYLMGVFSLSTVSDISDAQSRRASYSLKQRFSDT